MAVATEDKLVATDHERAVMSLWEDLPDRSGMKVFDGGVGSGRSTRLLQELGMKVTATTIAAERPVEIPEDAQALTRFDLNTTWPIEDDSFNGVLLKDVLEHLENPAHIVREVVRILRPGGVVVISTPNMLNASSRIRFAVTGFYEGRKRPISYAKSTGDAGNVYIPPLTLLHYLLAQSGMQIEKMVLGPPFIWNSLFFAVVLYPFFWMGTTLSTSRVRRQSMLPRDARRGTPREKMEALKRRQLGVTARLRSLMLSKEVLLGRNLIFRARLTGVDPLDA